MYGVLTTCKHKQSCCHNNTFIYANICKWVSLPGCISGTSKHLRPKIQNLLIYKSYWFSLQCFPCYPHTANYYILNVPVLSIIEIIILSLFNQKIITAFDMVFASWFSLYIYEEMKKQRWALPFEGCVAAWEALSPSHVEPTMYASKGTSISIIGWFTPLGEI